MRLGPLNHVGVVTPSIAGAAAFYREVMGATQIGAPIYTAGDTIRICFVETPNVLIELIEPLDDASDVAAFLRANPAGAQHHLCYEVADIQAAWDGSSARAQPLSARSSRASLDCRSSSSRPKAWEGP